MTDVYFSQFQKLEVWGQDASMIGVQQAPTFRLQTADLLCPRVAERGLESSPGSFYKGTDLLMRAPPSLLNHFPKPHFLIPSHWGLGFNLWILGDINTQPKTNGLLLTVSPVTVDEAGGKRGLSASLPLLGTLITMHQIKFTSWGF